jgi:hypothetical protein
MRTYGVVERASDEEGGGFRIRAEPHVMLKLKRVFPKIHKGTHGTVVLSDTEENAADLRWFLIRYPMELRDAQRLHARADAFAVRSSAIEALLSGKIAPPALELALPPRPYQRLAAAIAMRAGGLLLADDVGLGKTVSAIAALAGDPNGQTLPAAVVTLTHLPTQWRAELARFAPGLRVHIVTSTTPYDVRDAEGRLPDVLLLNYHKLAGWAEALAPWIRSVVFDEVQELRREGSAKYGAAKYVAAQAKLRMGLSATPIYNWGGEIWNVIDVLRPGALGSREEFLREWCLDDGGGRPKIREPRAFGTHLRDAGLMLRRTRSDVGRELPALTKVPHHIDADVAALDRVDDAAAELCRRILELSRSSSGSPHAARSARGNERFAASERLSTMLRQATGIAKAPFVAEFVRLLVESGERVLLFGWHREVYSIWQSRLADLDPAIYTGTESESQKARERERFVAGKTPVMMMSLRAGAGLDGLQHICRTVVFGELDWSPGVHEQCVGRVHRDGQREPVLAYYLVAEHGADPTMADVLGLKKAQIDGLRDPHGALVEALEADGRHVQHLASAYLRQRGLAATVAPTDKASA